MVWLAPWSFLPRRAGAPADVPALFFYSQVVWDEVWQRPQEYALRAVRNRPVEYFCPVQIHRLYDSLRSWRRMRVLRDGPYPLIIHTPLIFPGEYRSRPIRWLNRLLILAEARHRVGSGAGHILLSNSPFAEALSHRFRWRARIYDRIDDYTAFEWAPPESVDWERALIAQCDRVMTGTRFLCDDARKQRPDAEFIPCGVDFGLFERIRRTEPALPDDMRSIPAPVVGYVGSLSDRLDRALIARAAERYPHVSFVLIGPIHGSFGSPPRADNIHYLGLKPHDALPEYMARFDLAVMPFRMTPAALATNPVKTLEYLAAGCVVLSMPIPDVVRFYSDVVAIADTPEDFIDRIGALLTEDPAERQARGIEKARGASWDAMADRMEELIQSAQISTFANDFR